MHIGIRHGPCTVRMTAHGPYMILKKYIDGGQLLASRRMMRRACSDEMNVTMRRA